MALSSGLPLLVAIIAGMAVTSAHAMVARRFPAECFHFISTSCHRGCFCWWAVLQGADVVEEYAAGGAGGEVHLGAHAVSDRGDPSVQVWEHDRWSTHRQQLQADEEADLETES